jgi:folate-binding protein YgfZ
MHPFYASLADSPASGFRCAALPGLQAIQAAGPDALDFLHGQLTQDVRALDAHNAALAGYCTAKGRLLATLVMWQAAGDDAGYLALVKADVAEPLMKRLRMFVLRSKVTLTPVPLHIAGVWGNAPSTEMAAAAGGPLPTQPWQRADLPTGTWVAAPSGAGARWWWIATDTQLSQNGATLALLLGRGDAETWRAGDLAAGMPWVGALTQDLFIPQTVNLDLVGGVSFTKGCYPGQEVVARSHYRGTVKRRMAYGIVANAPADGIAPGTDIYDSTRPDEPCGRVVDSAKAPEADVLFETTLESLLAGQLRLGAPDGPTVSLRPLPYVVA